MINRGPRETPIRAGDADGLGQVYSEFGGLILGPTETVLAERKGWDLAAYGSWRSFLGARQYCEVNLSQFRLAGIKRGSWFMRFRLLASNGSRYELFLRTDQEDADFFDLLESTVRKLTVHM